MLYKRRCFAITDSLFSTSVSFLFSESRFVRRLMNFLKGERLMIYNHILDDTEIIDRYLIEDHAFVMQYEEIRELKITDTNFYANKS